MADSFYNWHTTNDTFLESLGWGAWNRNVLKLFYYYIKKNDKEIYQSILEKKQMKCQLEVIWYDWSQSHEDPWNNS